MSDPKYVVYAVLVDGIPRYYGEGTKSRPKEQLRIYKPVVLHFKPDAKVRVRILRTDLTKVDAIVVEKKLIAAAPKGQLWNGNNGGSGSTSEIARRNNARKSTRDKIAASLRVRWTDPNFRQRNLTSRKGKMARVLTPTQIEVMRAGVLNYHRRVGHTVHV